ncbi:MAG: cytochrome c [Chloroflexi bacterium]|nr:cytochrome c [Chloroflexota bacterium]
MAVLLLGVIASGCLPWGRGTSQVEIFSEMHYSQSYRSQEPPRLYPAQGSVPFLLVGQDTLEVTEFVLAKTQATVSQGSDLYGVNCAVCHGASGKGDGPLREFLIKYQSIPPADITGPATSAASDADLLSFIGGGGRIGFFSMRAGAPSPSAMPIFNKLLTKEEQWKLVHYLRDLQGQ